MAILYVLYKTSWNFIISVLRPTCHDYVIKIWNPSKNVYKNYEVFIVNIYTYLEKKFMNFLYSINSLINIIVIILYMFKMVPLNII
jgi:hypothetical protein